MEKKEDIEKIRPLRDSIICEVIVKATKSGIILSDSAKENAERIIKAVKVGPDVKQVKAGDELMVNPYEFVNSKLRIDDDYLLISEQCVIAVR